MVDLLPIIAVLCGATIAVALGTVLAVFLVRRRREDNSSPAQPASSRLSEAPPWPSPEQTPQWMPGAGSNLTLPGRGGAAVPAQGWALTLLDGPDSGRRFPLGTQSRVGRSPGLEVVINDPQVSRHHATIECSQESAVVSDAGSSNGTFINGTRIHDPTLLTHGDTVRVGNTWLRIDQESAGGLAGVESYCARCGSALAPGLPACSTCGMPAAMPERAPAYAPAPAPPNPSDVPPLVPPPIPAYAPPRIAEPIVAVITGLARRKGLVGVQEYNLVLTDQRLVFDRITNEVLAEGRRFGGAANGQGGGQRVLRTGGRTNGLRQPVCRTVRRDASRRYSAPASRQLLHSR